MKRFISLLLFLTFLPIFSTIARAASRPNDPFLADQWHLERIRAYDAWDTTMGSPSVRVAILDTGVLKTHEDLEGRIHSAYDFFDGEEDAADDTGRGTHMAGIVAAAANNGKGVAGVAPDVRLVVADVCGTDGSSTPALLREGIGFALRQGARVVCMGAHNAGGDAALSREIARAAESGVVVVCAAGNDNSDAPVYPADDENAVSVISIRMNGDKNMLSNYGEEKDLCAPGDAVYTTALDIRYPEITEVYSWEKGTEAAAAIVSGVFALLFSEYPRLTARQAIGIVCESAADLGEAGRDALFGHGLVDARAALALAAERVSRNTGLRVSPQRPVLQEDPQAAISFNTERSGYYTVAIRNEAGVAVRTLRSATRAAAGSQRVTWNLTDGDGKKVPPGVYAVSVDFSTEADGSGYASRTICTEAEVAEKPLRLTGCAVSPLSAVYAEGSVDIGYTTNVPARIAIRVHDATGACVRSLAGEEQAAGRHRISWDLKDNAGRFVGPGEYTARIQGEDAYGLTQDGYRSQNIAVAPDSDGLMLVLDNRVDYTRPVLFAKKTMGDRLAVRFRINQHGSARMDVLDAQGKVVRTIARNGLLPDAESCFEWDATTDSGLHVPSGGYTARITATGKDGKASRQKTFCIRLDDGVQCAVANAAASPSPAYVKHNRLAVSYRLDCAGHVTITVCDAKDKTIATLRSQALQAAGSHTVKWDLRDKKGAYVKTGAYRVRVIADNGSGHPAGEAKINAKVVHDLAKPEISLNAGGTLRFKNKGSKNASVGFWCSEKGTATATVIDRKGKTVRTLTLAIKKAKRKYAFKWDGKDKAGVYVPSGTYTIRIRAKDAAGNASASAKRKIRLTDYTKPAVTAPASVVFDKDAMKSVGISVTLSEPAYVSARLYDRKGKFVCELKKRAFCKSRKCTVRFDGRDARGRTIASSRYGLQCRIVAKDKNNNTTTVHTAIKLRKKS